MRNCFAVKTLIVSSFVIASTSFSQDKKPTEKQEPPMGIPDMAAAMKKWQNAITPGPHHKKLDYFVGNWKTTTRIWMAGPSAPPSEFKGTSQFKWIMDGRFLLEEFSGEIIMPTADGKMQTVKMSGSGWIGYDNYKNLYTGAWIDTNRTDIQTMTGMADPSGKTFTFYGPMDEPMLDVYGRTVKFVRKIVDDKKFVFEIFDLHAGSDYRVLEITYERT